MFKKQYFSILFWKSLVYLMGVGSLLVITPHLTRQPKIFGIYAFCSSIIIFFSYADLGFITAARKFSAEYVAKKQLKSEIAVTAFSSLIFLLFSIPISAGLLFLSFHPQLLIKDLVDIYEQHIASSLLIILALSFPILILQRVIQIIYSVRLEDYHVFKFEIFSIILKILGVFYFFSNGRYQIIEYFLYFNILNLINLIFLAVLAAKRYHYDFVFFAKSLRYRKSVYDKVSSLAFNSLFVSLAWLLFYEIDILLVTTFSGALAAAQYAIAYNIANILRNLLGTIYYPFTVKFNHLYVTNKEQLKNTLYTIIKIGAYLIIPGLSILAAMAGPLIISWVGKDFLPAVLLMQFLVGAYVFYPLNTPIAALLTTQMEIKVLYVNSLLMLVIQYLGLVIFYNTGDFSTVLAVLKIVCIGVSTVLLLRKTLSYLGFSIGFFFSRVIILPVILSLVFGYLAWIVAGNFTFSKGLGNLLLSAALASLFYLITISVLFLVDKSFRKQLFSIVKR